MIKDYIVYFASLILMICIGKLFVPDTLSSYFEWVIYAGVVFFLCVIFVVIVSLCFNYKQVNGLLFSAIKRGKKHDAAS